MELTDLVYIDATGYHYADFPTFQAWLIGKYQGIYGADVYLGPDSQDGQFLGILSQAFYDSAALGASVYNSFSPATAQGVGLARVVKINGISKRIASFSTVDLDVGGTSGTPIVNGVAIDTLQQKWNLPDCIIPDAGTISVTATAQQVGAVPAAPDTVNSIFTPTLGWQTVNNPLIGTAGAPIETDAELRMRQAVSTANPSLTVLEGSVGSVANLAGVTNARGYENDNGTTDGNGIPGHNVCIVVEGGDSFDIASDIALHKTPGAGTFGDVTENVFDAKGLPIAISFQRAVPVTITCTVTISAGSGYSAGFAALIQQAIADVINAGDIGNTVFITKLYYPAYLNGNPAGQTYDVATVEIGKNSDAQSNINIPLGFDEIPICDPTTDVTIVVT